VTLDEAIAAFEKDFTVVSVAGFPDVDLDGRFDMDRAPSGARYVEVRSGWFESEDEGAEGWLREAWRYAEDRGGSVLYWREQPTWHSAEFIAVNQAALLNDRVLRSAISLRLGVVYSRLLVSQKSAGKG